MDLTAKLDDRHLIEHALKVMRSNPRTFPEDRVRKLLALIGAELQKSGRLDKEVVDRLLQQAKQEPSDVPC